MYGVGYGKSNILIENYVTELRSRIYRLTIPGAMNIALPYEHVFLRVQLPDGPKKECNTSASDDDNKITGLCGDEPRD